MTKKVSGNGNGGTAHGSAGSLDTVVRVGSAVALALVAIGGVWAVITRLSGSRSLASQGGHDELPMRRPLQFLTHRLSLDERQRSEVGQILDELKAARSQAAAETRSTEAALANALMADTLESAQLSETTGLRMRHSERLHQASATALGRLHALLNPAQRREFATLIRGGAL